MIIMLIDTPLSDVNLLLTLHNLELCTAAVQGTSKLVTLADVSQVYISS